MPTITFEAGQLTRQVKQDLIIGLTKASAKITSIPETFFTITIREWPDENLAIGGKSVAQIKTELEGS